MSHEEFLAEFQRLCTARQKDCWMYVDQAHSGFGKMVPGVYCTRVNFSDGVFDCDDTAETVLRELRAFLSVMAQDTDEWRREVVEAMGL